MRKAIQIATLYVDNNRWCGIVTTALCNDGKIYEMPTAFGSTNNGDWSELPPIPQDGVTE